MRILIPALILCAAPAAAAAPVELAIGRIGAAGPDGRADVELIAINPGPDAASRALPPRIEAGGANLVRADDQPERVTIPPGGFARLRYRSSGAPRSAALSLPVLEEERFADAPPQPEAPAAAPVATASAEAFTPRAPSADADRGNAFLGNLSAYEPIYAVYGPGTNSDARVQISFKYQLFGDPGAVGAGAPALNGIHFAFTQRLFWDLGAESSPFRTVDYLPEIFYLLPARAVGAGRVAIGAQAGLRHESNGRSGDASRSFNTLYVQPVATLPVGDYKLTVGPRLWTYVGKRSDNPDIRRFRGNTGLFAEFGQDDGLRLTTTGRMNFGSGKGAIDAQLSYPMDRIVASSLNLYLFGQAFAGYGENLLDYDRVQHRLRIGIGIVR